MRTDVSIFTLQTCSQPPEPDLELESSLCYSGFHFRAWWGDGGGVCPHRHCSALCPPHAPPLVSSSPFIHMTSRKMKGSGRGRPQAWEEKLWLSTVCGSPLSPERVTRHLSRCHEGWPAFLMSTLVTERWVKVVSVTVKSSGIRSGRKGEIDESGPADSRTVLSIP